MTDEVELINTPDDGQKCEIIVEYFEVSQFDVYRGWVKWETKM